MNETFDFGSRNSRDGSRPFAGFTIVELLIVLSLVSVMAAVAAPLLSIGRHQAEAAMQNVGSILLAAQRRAVSRQHDIIVIIDVPSSTLRIIDDANNDGDFNTGEHRTAIPIGDGVVFGRGGVPAHAIGSGPITFAGRFEGQPGLVFHRDGSASEGGGIYVQASRENATGGTRGARLITVERSTGRPSWFRYAGSSWVRGF